MIFPKTLLKLVVGVFVLTAIPLLFAVGDVIIKLNLLATHAQQAVVRGEQAGVASRELRERAGAFERVVRQALVLEDTSVLADVRTAYGRLDSAIERALLLPTDDQAVATLNALRQPARELVGAFAAGLPEVSQRKEIAERVAQLTDRAEAGGKVLDGVARSDSGDLQTQAEAGRDNLPWLLGAAAGLALLLGLGFALWWARPLSSLDKSMRRLGQARFDEPIAIRGPQDLRGLGQRLEWVRERLRTLESQQAAFLRQISHALKTPLTAIREGAELMRDGVTGPLSSEQSEVVRIIRDNTLQLQKLINDLLSYQQHRSGIPLKREQFVVPDLVSQVVREHKLELQSKGVILKAKIAPLAMDTDRERLRVVIDNLLSNAVRFSPQGGTIHLRATGQNTVGLPLRARGQQLQFEIEDQGPGVRADEREKIFETFFQGTVQADANIKGSGIGLAIVKEYVTAMGGTIELVNPGQPGAVFRLAIPLKLSVESMPIEVAR